MKDRVKLKCPRDVCGHEWYPRVKMPVECPRCKTYSDKWGEIQDIAPVDVEEDLEDGAVLR